MQQGASVAPQQFKSNEGQQSKLFSTKPIQRPFCAPISSVTSEELTMSACPTPTQNILSSVGYNGMSQTSITNNAFNSLNIRRLVQQSNNYWQAERTFFSTEKKNPVGGHEKLDNLERSILNAANDGGSYNSFSYLGEGGVVPLSPVPQPTQSSKSPFTGRHQTADGTSTAVTGGGTTATTTTATYFSQSRRLQEISFSFSLVKKGATELGKFSLSMNSDCLQIVDLSYNKFRDVPQEVINLKQLRVLKMDTNLIKVLNPELFTQLKLEYFSIANNLLFEVPELIVLWKDTLKYLDISLNRIEHLQTLSELRLLQSLHIQNNDFRYLPTSLHVLMNSQFKELSLDWFQYTQPPLDLQQSGQLGMRVIQRLKAFLQTQFERNIQAVSFMDAVLQLSGSPSNYDIMRIDQKNHNRSLSHLAAAREEIGCLVSLLENKYSLINSLDSEGHTPLSLSILNEKFFSAKTLISNGADVNLGGALFGNCLNLAVIKYQYYLVLDLLKRGANPNAQDSEGNTPLHYIMTIFHRDVDYSSKICDLLLQFRADPNILNKDLWAPIHLLSRRGTVEALKFIQDYNQYLITNNFQNIRLADKITNFAGNPVIRMSSTPFQPFSINILGGKERQTPLHIACWHSCYNLANLLIQSGADIFARDSANRIPLHLCMRDNFLYKLLKQKETAIFNEQFSVKRQMSQEYGEETNQFTNQTPLKTIFTNQSLVSVSPNRTNYSQPFTQRNQTNSTQNGKKSNEILSYRDENKDTFKCQSKPETKNASQQNEKGSQSASKPCFSQHQLKGSDSLISLDDLEDNSNINDINDPSEIVMEKNRKPSQIKESLVNSRTSGRLTDRREEDDEVHESSSKLAEIAVMPGMSVKGNSKNQNFQDEEKEQAMQPCQGQLCRNSLVLSKQKHKQGEDENQSLNFDNEKVFDPSNFQDLDEKEEEFLNSEIDEAKSMLELFNTKQKIINQSLAYAPNNIQQLNYIQAINRANLKKYKNSHHTQQHLRSRSEIPSRNKIFQKPTSENQSTAAAKDKPSGLIKNDGIDVPLQMITPQHISFFQYLLEKTKNMYEYYSVSLHNYKKGILSEFSTLYEKYRYFNILLKLQVEFQNMILHLLEEKKQLSSLLGGDVPFLQMGAIDQDTTNIMVMKILLEIVMNLKCENYQQLLIKRDFPSPSFHTFLFSSQTPNSNVSYWMRQYEESFSELLPMHTSVQEELNNFDGDCNPKANDNRTATDKALQFQEVNLNERENTLIKENIIYQLGNYHFKDALDYLEGEIKSPNISTLNAFEACQSFFKIKDNLISQPSTQNNNQTNKNIPSLTSKPVSDCDINESIQSALSPSFAKQTFLKSASIRPATASQPKQALTQRQRQNSGQIETQRTSTDERGLVNSYTNQQIAGSAQNNLKQRKDSLLSQNQQQLQLTDKPPNNLRGTFSSEIPINNQPFRQGTTLPQSKPPQSPISAPQSKIFPQQVRKKGSSLGMASSEDDDSFNLIVPSDIQFPSDSSLINSQLNCQLLSQGQNIKSNSQVKHSYLIPISQFSSSLLNRNSRPFS